MKGVKEALFFLYEPGGDEGFCPWKKDFPTNQDFAWIFQEHIVVKVCL